jgi:hypothetical protein
VTGNWWDDIDLSSITDDALNTLFGRILKEMTDRVSTRYSTTTLEDRWPTNATIPNHTTRCDQQIAILESRIDYWESNLKRVDDRLQKLDVWLDRMFPENQELPWLDADRIARNTRTDHNRLDERVHAIEGKINSLITLLDSAINEAKES